MQPTASSVLAPQMPQAQTVDPSSFGEYSDWAQKEMAAGASADDLHAALQQNGVSMPQQQTAPQAQPEKKGNWFTHLLPTIGGIAVPTIGALLAPVTGGASLLAAAGLGAIGTAAGKAGENALEGKGVLDKGVATAGIEGGIGGLAGGVLGKVFGKGASLLASRAEGIAAKKAAAIGAEDAINGLATAYKDVSPGLQKVYNAKDSLKHVAELGFDATQPKNLVHVANTSNDILNDVLNNTLKEGGPLDLSSYTDLVRKRLAEEAGTLGSYEKIALSRGRLGNASTPSAKLLQQLEDLGAGIAKPNADPNQVRELTSKLYSLAQDAKPTITASTGAIDPEQRAVYKVISSLRDDVKGLLYDRPEINAAIKSMKGNLTPDDVGGSAELANYLNKVITEAGTGTDSGAQALLNTIRRNIDIGNLGQEGEKVAQIVTSTGGKARAATEAGLDVVDNTPGTFETVANVAGQGGGVAKTALNGVVHASQNPAILKTLSRMGKLAEKVAPVAGVTAGTLPNLAADPVAPSVTMGTTNPGNSIQGTNMQNGPVNDQQSLINAMRAQAVLAPSMAGDSGATSFLASIAPMLQKNAMLSTTLSGIPEAYGNAGGAQGTAGILSRLSGLIPGTAANTYNAEQEAAANQLAAALGISPQAAKGLLPQLMQSGGVAGQQQGILGQMQGNLAL